MQAPNPTEILDLIKKAQANGLPAEDVLSKAFAVATGLVAYDLEPAAKRTFPILTPLRNKVPRVGNNGVGDTATRWKEITGINVNNVHPGISEGQRGAVIATTVVDKLAAYVGIGLEDNVTFEAEYAQGNIGDVKALAVEGLLQSTMISEEKHIWGGNADVALGTTPTPTVANAGTGGSIAAATYNVACVALTHQGWLRSSLGSGVVGQISKTNADGSSDTINGGAAQKSATTGTTSTISASVAAVRGAIAYAWYVGTAGSEKLEAITTINSVKLTALAGTGQALSALTAADYSAQGAYSFSGFLYTALKSGSGAYYFAQPTGTAGTGTPLTTDNAGGIAEINDALRYWWDNYRLSPDEMWCSAQEIVNISSKVIASGGAPLFRFQVDANAANFNIIAGAKVGQYMNKLTNTLIDVRLHPDATLGTILFTSSTLPYRLPGIGNLFQIKTRREYYQIEWPLKTRKYEYGVYVDEVFQHRFPPSLGVITNIANG